MPKTRNQGTGKCASPLSPAEGEWALSSGRVESGSLSVVTAGFTMNGTFPLASLGNRSVPMADDGSVTRWFGLLQAGDPAAAQQLWERYFRRLVGLARKRLRGAARRATDEEDVALSAFDSFCH